MSDAPDRDDFSYLPPTLAEIARLAGLKAAIALATAKGGQEVYIPRRAPDTHWLVEAIGRDAADAVSSHFGDQRITVPIGAQHLARRRAAEMLADGQSLNRVAMQTGRHVRTIKRIRKRMREDDGQGGLF